MQIKNLKLLNKSARNLYFPFVLQKLDVESSCPCRGADVEQNREPDLALTCEKMTTPTGFVSIYTTAPTTSRAMKKDKCESKWVDVISHCFHRFLGNLAIDAAHADYKTC